MLRSLFIWISLPSRCGRDLGCCTSSRITHSAGNQTVSCRGIRGSCNTITYADKDLISSAPQINLKPSTTNVHKITGISLEVVTSASDNSDTSSDVSSEGSQAGKTRTSKSRASKPKGSKPLKANSRAMKAITKSTQRKHLTTSGTHEGAGLEWRVRQPGTGDTVRRW
jgi:hypothetical protein